MKLLHIRNNIFLNLRSNSASENLNGAFVQALRWVLLWFFADKSMKRGKPAICEALLVLKLSARAGHRFSGVYVVDV